MKLYRIEIKFTGYITKQFSGNTFNDAKDTARQWFEAGMECQDLTSKSLEFQLLNTQSEKAPKPESKPLISIEAFDKMVSDFLDIQDNEESHEAYCTDYEAARSVLDSLREHLFEEQLAKEIRYNNYLELKKEFEDEAI